MFSGSGPMRSWQGLGRWQDRSDSAFVPAAGLDAIGVPQPRKSVMFKLYGRVRWGILRFWRMSARFCRRSNGLSFCTFSRSRVRLRFWILSTLCWFALWNLQELAARGFEVSWATITGRMVGIQASHSQENSNSFSSDCRSSGNELFFWLSSLALLDRSWCRTWSWYKIDFFGSVSRRTCRSWPPRIWRKAADSNGIPKAGCHCIRGFGMMQASCNCNVSIPWATSWCLDVASWRYMCWAASAMIPWAALSQPSNECLVGRTAGDVWMPWDLMTLCLRFLARVFLFLVFVEVGIIAAVCCYTPLVTSSDHNNFVFCSRWQGLRCPTPAGGVNAQWVWWLAPLTVSESGAGIIDSCVVWGVSLVACPTHAFFEKRMVRLVACPTHWFWNGLTTLLSFFDGSHAATEAFLTRAHATDIVAERRDTCCGGSKKKQNAV